MSGEASLEQQIVVEFRGGDTAAFEALFRHYQHDVFRWILRIVRDHAIAEDLTIETFFRIHRARERFDASREFAPWARRIATRAALDWIRVHRPEHGMTEDFFAAVPSASAADPVISAEVRHHVAAALALLPQKLRVAAVLALIEERPQREIADALGITVAAVKLRIFRAMRKLRNYLEQQGIRP
jgi:RNA polymerase sigma-70 factor, ECF subfamily